MSSCSQIVIILSVTRPFSYKILLFLIEFYSFIIPFESFM